jgi:hypothetical protein
MKIYYLFVLFLFSIALGSCEKSNEEKAKESIRKYLNENLDDMSTYESVKFGNLDTVSKLDIRGTSIESEKVKYLFMYQMFHSYRLKDEKGAKYITKNYFKLNGDFEVIEFGTNSFAFDPMSIVENAYADSAAADTSSPIYELPLMPIK